MVVFFSPNDELWMRSDLPAAFCPLRLSFALGPLMKVIGFDETEPPTHDTAGDTVEPARTSGR